MRMSYNSNDGLWQASIPKKYDTSTLYYWINVTDYGANNLSDMYAKYGPEKYSYTTPMDFQYRPCIIGAVIFFAAFEVIMHYSRLRESFPGKKDREDENPEKMQDEEKKRKDESGQ